MHLKKARLKVSIKQTLTSRNETSFDDTKASDRRNSFRG